MTLLFIYLKICRQVMLEKMLNRSCINCLRYASCFAPLDYKLTFFFFN